LLPLDPERPASAGRIIAPTEGCASLLPLPRVGTVLAFDFGERRIGVAVGEFELRIAHALAVIPAVPTVERYRAVENLVNEWRPILLAVGLPSYPDGLSHPVAGLCRKFARSLEGRFRIPVALVDERLSTAAASCELGETGFHGRAQTKHLDAAAAAQILATLFSEIDARA
jgi:putative Holliday junction resolvase